MSTTAYTTRLRIADQREILNQIAATYTDFYRAAMEYIDNAIDAAYGRRENVSSADREPSFVADIVLNVDTKRRVVSVKDNCGGMGPQELCELLSNVGLSKKKKVPWANGQFGFGVHAFRAFARKATFTSNTTAQGQFAITIDRETDENTDVPCEESSRRAMGRTHGTLVEVSEFDPHVFRKDHMRRKLSAESERHFGDVLRAGVARIQVTEDYAQPYHCRPFNYDSLPGVAIHDEIDVAAGGRQGKVAVDLKVLEKQLPDDSQLAILAKKGRRIQAIAYLGSFRNCIRELGGRFDVWSTRFVTGSIDVGDFCDPNITRDDLKQDSRASATYEKLLDVQLRVQEALEDLLQKHAKASLKKVGDLFSQLLRDVLKRFRLQFEVSAPRAEPGPSEQQLTPIGTTGGLGGPEPGGGGEKPTVSPGAGGSGPGGAPGEPPAGPGPEPTGAGGPRGQTSELPGRSQSTTKEEPGPRITFQPLPDRARIIDLGGSIVVNTAHEDFRTRNRGDEADIRFDDRLINYVAMVVTPPCVHRIVEKSGKVLKAIEIVDNAVNLATQLERRLIEAKKDLQSSVTK